MTPIGPGTWDGAKAASDAAATAADLVLGGVVRGLRHLPSARPPRGPGVLRRQLLPEQRGRRRGPAASRRRREGGAPRHRRAPRERHPGLLLGRPVGALRIAPRRPGGGLVPPHGGLRGRGRRVRHERQRAGATGLRRRPLARRPRSADPSIDGFDPAAVVVSLGVDAAAEDPNSPLEVTEEGFATAGRTGLGEPPARRCSSTRAGTCWTPWPATPSPSSRPSRRAPGGRPATPHDRSLNCSAATAGEAGCGQRPSVSSTNHGNSSANTSSTSGCWIRALIAGHRGAAGRHQIADGHEAAAGSASRAADPLDQHCLLVGLQVVDRVRADHGIEVDSPQRLAPERTPRKLQQIGRGPARPPRPSLAPASASIRPTRRRRPADAHGGRRTRQVPGADAEIHHDSSGATTAAGPRPSPTWRRSRP